MSKFDWSATFTCPAAMGDQPCFATSGHQQPSESWRFFATFGGHRFAATVHQERLAVSGVRRRSTADSDRQAFDTIGSGQELATDCQLQKRAAPCHGKQLADASA